jgi:hypothetical protein
VNGLTKLFSLATSTLRTLRYFTLCAIRNFFVYLYLSIRANEASDISSGQCGYFPYTIDIPELDLSAPRVLSTPRLLRVLSAIG